MQIFPCEKVVFSHNFDKESNSVPRQRHGAVLFTRHCLAIAATVLSFLSVRKQENVVNILLRRGNTTGVLTLDYIDQLFGRRNMALPCYFAVFDDVNGGIGAYVANNLKVDINLTVNLYNVLFSHL